MKLNYYKKIIKKMRIWLVVTSEPGHVDLAVVVGGHEQSDVGYPEHGALAEGVVAPDDLQPRQGHHWRKDVGVDGHEAADVTDRLIGPGRTRLKQGEVSWLVQEDQG